MAWFVVGTGVTGRRRSAARSRRALALAIAAAAAAISDGSGGASAATIYFDGSNPNWNTALAWSTASNASIPDPGAPPGSTDIAVFNITTNNVNQTISLNAPQAAQGLSFTSTGSVLIQSGGGSNSLTLGASGITINPGAGADTITAPVFTATGTQTWANNGVSTFQVSGSISIGTNLTIAGSTVTALTGSVTGSSLTKNGTALLSINGATDNTGLGMVVNAGTVFLAKSSGAAVHAVGGGGLTINGGLVLFGGSGSDQIYDFANVAINSGGAMELSGASETFAGLTMAGSGASGGGALVNSAAAGSVLQLNNGVTFAGDTAISIPQAGGNITFNGTIGGSGGLIKTGLGTLTIFGTSANTYTGTTTVNDGTLLLAKAYSTRAMNGALVIGDGVGAPGSAVAMISNNGYQLNGLPVTINADGKFDFGNNAADEFGDLTMTGGSITGTNGSFYYLNGNVTTLASSQTALISATNGAQVYMTGVGPGPVPHIFNVAQGSTGSGIDLDVNAPLHDYVYPMAVVKTGAGTMRLSSASNDYSGGTTVSAGTIAIGDDHALGTGPLVGNGGAIRSDGAARTIANPVTLTSSGLFVTGGLDLTLTGVISGTAGISKNGTGTLVLGGSSANTFTGGFALNGGPALIANPGALNPTTPNDVNLQSLTSVLSLNGNSVSVGRFISLFGNAILQNANSTPATLTITGAQFSEFFCTVQDGAGGGALGLNINPGSGGTVYMFGLNNTYSGVTTVTSGTLVLSLNGLGSTNELGASFILTNVLSGGTLDVAGESVPEWLNLAGAGDGGVGSLVNNSATPVTLPGIINNGTSSSFSVGGFGDITLTGPILNFSTLTKVGNNTLTLADATDDRGMALIVNGGTVVLDKASNTTSIHAVGGGGLTINSGVVEISGTGGDQIYDFCPVTITGGSLDANGIGEGVYFVTASIHGTGNNGIGALVNTANNASALTFAGIMLTGDTSIGVTQSGGALTLPEPISEDSPGRILTKVGLGNLVLTSANTYTGGLVISAGTVTQPSGSIAANITNNATFVSSGTGGTVTGAIVNNGTLQVSFGATLTLATSTATIDNEGTLALAGGTIASSGAAITNNDMVSGSGTISGTGSFTNNAQITVAGGHLTLANTGAITNSGTINLAGAYQLRLTGSGVNNFGAINLNAGTLTGSATLTNRAGGTVIGPGSLLAPFANNAGLVLIPAGGATNISTAWSNTGEIQLTDPAANLIGGAISNTGTLDGVGSVGSSINNTGTIEAIAGTLRIGGTLTNGAAGLLRTGTGSKLLVTAGLSTNAGILSLVGGTFDNNGQPLNNAGQISGYGTLSTGGLTNNGTFTLTGGVSTINGPVNNGSGKSIAVRYNPALFTGAVTNNGTIKITNTTVTFAGPYSGNIYISDPSDNFFQSDVTITGGGNMTGGSGDRFYLSGGTFTNNGTFTNGGLLNSADNTINTGSFTQTGPQAWSNGTTFTNTTTAANATFGTDCGSPTSSTLNVHVNGGGVTFTTTQHLASIALAASSTATLTAGGTKILVAGSVASSGKLDITDNKLITQSPVGTWNGSGYTGVTALLASGRNGSGLPLWDGGGIVTSQSTATAGNYTTLAIARGVEVKSSTATATALWAGQTITGTDTLVMYTYGGDANLDGKINVDDYIKIDSGIASGLQGWVNGDFNYDGKVNIDDYTTVIDANISIQSGVFPSAEGIGEIGNVVAIPEPFASAMLLLFVPVFAMTRRRRERRGRFSDHVTQDQRRGF